MSEIVNVRELRAAVALANQLPLYTCNPDAFTGIDGLEVVLVPAPTAPAHNRA